MKNITIIEERETLQSKFTFPGTRGNLTVVDIKTGKVKTFIIEGSIDQYGEGPSSVEVKDNTVEFLSGNTGEDTGYHLFGVLQ